MTGLNGSCFVPGRQGLASTSVSRQKYPRRAPAGPRSTWGHEGISERSPSIKSQYQTQSAPQVQTYTRHQLEDGGLSKLEEMNDLLKTIEHRLVVTHSLGHTTGQAVAQSVVNVQLAG